MSVRFFVIIVYNCKHVIEGVFVDSDNINTDHSDIDIDESDEESDICKLPLEIGFDKMICRICGMP